MSDTWKTSLALASFEIKSICPKESGPLDNQIHDLSGKAHSRKNLANRVSSTGISFSLPLCSAVKCFKKKKKVMK